MHQTSANIAGLLEAHREYETALYQNGTNIGRPVRPFTFITKDGVTHPKKRLTHLEPRGQGGVGAVKHTATFRDGAPELTPGDTATKIEVGDIYNLTFARAGRFAVAQAELISFARSVKTRIKEHTVFKIQNPE